MFLKKSTASPKAAASLAGALGRFFNEISSVTQQKRLTAQFGPVRVVVDVSNRELLKVISVEPESWGQGVTEIAARDDDALREQLDKLGLFFGSLTEIGGDVAIESSLVPLRYSTKLQGFSKDELTIAVLSNSRPIIQSAPAAVADIAPPPVVPAPPIETPAPDLRFFQQVASKSDAAIVMDWSGQILQQSGQIALFDGLGDVLLADMSQWIMNTHQRVSTRQFVVLRGPDATQFGVCIMTEPASLTIIIFSATSTGRVFSAVSHYAA